MERYSSSLIVREMQIRTTITYHFSTVMMADIKKRKYNKSWWGSEEIGTLVYYWWECKIWQPPWKTIWRFLRILKTGLPYNPAFPFLGMYPKELKTGFQRDMHTSVFIAALFTITKRWKQLKCLSADEWIKKMWHIHPVGYYSALKRKEILCMLQHEWALGTLCEVKDTGHKKTNSTWFIIWGV